MSGKGRRYEHTLVNGLDRITEDQNVWVAPVGFSGNDAITGSDLVVVYNPPLHEAGAGFEQYQIEAKKRSGDAGNRVSDVFAGSQSDETGVEEVRRLVEKTPDWAEPTVALKFDRRKLIVLNAWHLLTAMGEADRHVPEYIEGLLLDVLKPRVTDGGNVSLIKPELNNWVSSTAAPDDEVVLAEQLGLPYETEQ